jgi:hypothetical protein
MFNLFVMTEFGSKVILIQNNLKEIGVLTWPQLVRQVSHCVRQRQVEQVEVISETGLNESNICYLDLKF